MAGETSTDPTVEIKGSEITAQGKMLNALYGENAAEKIGAANVLVVGAGGVGCELLKNLALNGFRKVTVIDLDTIDVSNLNRQFLFRREHVGKSKAICAAEAIRKMVPTMVIEGIVANIKDTRFNVDFFKTFNVVCNALDNLEARRHVNRVSLAAKIPLIESGSTGYNGQISIHAPGYECYDCIPKKPTKAIAVCTIRSTPEKPVHCIVWAKSLWDLIFGPDDDGNLLADLDGKTANVPVEVTNKKEPNGTEANGTVPDEDARTEKSPVKKTVKRVRYAHPEPTKDFADRVCSRIFVDEINEQAAMEKLWTKSAPPKAFDVVEVASKSDLVDLKKVNLLEQRAWDAEESSRIFYSVLHHVVENRKKEIGTISFDKDDPDALAFVVAAANLRAESYRVSKSSPFAVKGIAGNIVHAIATTNAVVGGLVVQQALKIVMEGNIEKCRSAFFTRLTLGSRVKMLVNPSEMLPPAPNCYVCSKGMQLLTIDCTKYTLKNMIEYVLKKKLSVVEPSVYVTLGSFYNVLFECGVGLDEDEIETYTDNLGKTLAELKASNGATLSIDDVKQNLKCEIYVKHEEGCEEDKPMSEQFKLEGKKPEVKKEGGKNNEENIISTGVLKTSGVEDADELEVVHAKGTHFANEKEEKRDGDAMEVESGNGKRANGDSMGVDVAEKVKDLKRKTPEERGETAVAAKRLKENGSM